MTTWQVDCYRCPLTDDQGTPLWELLICDPDRQWQQVAYCTQAQVNGQWVQTELQRVAAQVGSLPTAIAVFRPATLHLLEGVAASLGVRLEPTRRLVALQQWLRQRMAYYPTQPNYTGQPHDPLQLDSPPPVPLPENLWGEQWRFAAIAAGELVGAFCDRPLPILDMPTDLLPLNLGIASTVAIPGVVIDGGRRAMLLARWLESACPYALHYTPGSPDGLILEAGLIDRWVLTTFTDPEVSIAGQLFNQRLQASAGLHFLLVQPDDSGMTYTGLWLLRHDPSV